MESLKAKMARLSQEGLAIVDGAKAADRDLTASEQATVDGLLDEMKTLGGKIEAAEKSDALMGRIVEAVSGASDYDDGEAAAKLVKAIRGRSSVAVQVPRKALTTPGLTLPAAGNSIVPAPVGSAATALRDLFRTEATDNPSVRYYEVGSVGLVSPATTWVTAEGATKPELDSTITPKTVSVQKLAARFTASTEMAEDAPAVLAEVQRQALLGLLRAEHTMILGVLDALTGHVTDTAETPDAIALILDAIATLESANGETPGWVLTHPSTWAAITAQQASTSGVFHSSPFAAGPRQIGGVPVTTSSAVAAGTIWLGSQNAGTIWQRHGVTITAGHNGDDLIKNLFTTVVEERLAFGVVAKGSLAELTLTEPAG